MGLTRTDWSVAITTTPPELSHGFVARVNLTGSGKPNTNTRKAPVKPAYALPEVSGIAVPAL